MQVEHWNQKTDGELTEQAMRDKLAQRGYQITRYTYPPGTHFPDHTHTVDKIDGVLSGRFRMTMGGHSAVPKGEVHSAEVIGSEPVISLDAVKSG